MRILFLTQYFPPETGAPQNRLFELAVRLQALGEEVTVLTAMPNYPSMNIHAGYRGKLFMKEDMNGLLVHRAWIYAGTSRSMIVRLLNYFSFVFTSMLYGVFSVKRHDVVFCESPPLFLGISARIICIFRRSRLVFNVSDLWPESAERLGLVKNRLLLGLSKRLEEYLYRKSVLISGQTQGIVADISARFPQKKVVWLPNGVDTSFYVPGRHDAAAWRRKAGIAPDRFVCLYAGILGYAQGLDTVLDAAAGVKDLRDVLFVLLGSGPEKKRLELAAAAAGLDNVRFMEPVGKAEMPSVLAGCNLTLAPLRRLDLFRGAIPSKIFESLAMEKPVLLGVDGEARKLFVDEGRCAVFVEPEDPSALAAAVRLLHDDPSACREMGINGRIYVEQHFNRNTLASAFHARLQEIPARD
jgi:glycosyltransferase involved in cell wall biosynthesis